MKEEEVFPTIGADGFGRLVAAFYRKVSTDDILGPMYPKDELHEAEERLRAFLIQRFGGPQSYSQQRGHPRLRMRHAPFKVDIHARNRWMELMTQALDETGVSEPLRAILLPYFANTATFMMNHP